MHTEMAEAEKKVCPKKRLAPSGEQIYITHLLIGEMLSPTRNKVNVQKTLNAMKGKIMGRSDMKKNIFKYWIGTLKIILKLLKLFRVT